MLVMAGFVRAIAMDLDGTLVQDGRFPDAAKDAIDTVRDDGLAAVLATGHRG